MHWTALGGVLVLSMCITACQTSSVQPNASTKKLDRAYLDQSTGLSSAALERHLQQAHPSFSSGPEKLVTPEGEWVIYRYDKVLEVPLYLPNIESNRMPAGHATFNVENNCYVIFKMNHQRVEGWHTTGKGCN